MTATNTTGQPDEFQYWCSFSIQSKQERVCVILSHVFNTNFEVNSVQHLNQFTHLIKQHIMEILVLPDDITVTPTSWPINVTGENIENLDVESPPPSLPRKPSLTLVR